MTTSAAPIASYANPYSNPPAPDSRYPWALIAAGLVAMGARFATGGWFIGVPLLAVVFAASAATHARLPDRFIVRWGLRSLLYVMVVTIMGIPEDEVSYWYTKIPYMNLIGVLMAAELTLRAWVASTPAKRGMAWGEGLLVSGLVMVCATTTYERPVIAIAGPLYVLMAMLTARKIGRANTTVTASTTPLSRRLTGFSLAQRFVATAVALSIGFVGVWIATNLERQLTTLAMQLLNQTRPEVQEIGLSTAPQLRTVFNPSPSMDRALRLEGVRGDRHIRVFAYDRYQQDVWVPRAEERSFRAVDPRNLHASRPGKTIRVVPLSDAARTWIAIPTEAQGLSVDVPIEADADGVTRPVPSASPQQWTVETAGGESPAIPLLAPLNADNRADFLGFPREVDPKVAELAQRVAGEGDTETKLLRLTNYLRANHKYSLRFEPTGEPLSDFILNKRDAHCQYFASAMAVMSRAVGIPSRFVTGFYAHEADGESDTMVRERDAHAWAECYVDGKGWIVVDATPASGRPDGLFPEPSAARKIWEAITDIPGQIREWLAAGGLTRAGGFAISLAAAAGIVWAVTRLAHRRRAPTAPTYEPADPELRLAVRRFEKQLARRGISLPPTATWRDNVALLEPDIAEFLNAYDRARFDRPTDELRRQLQTALISLEVSPVSPKSA